MTPDLNSPPPIEVPPPPYSETDIYSNAASRSPALSQSQNLPIRQRMPSHSIHDDASSATSNGEIIYTPPLTPQSSHSHFQAGQNPGFLSPAYPDQQNTISVASGHLTNASAEAYFDSRPVLTSVQGIEQIIHAITIGPDSSPDDLQFLEEWTHRDVYPVDWQTFLNHLFPNYAAERNEAIFDRKLRAERIANEPSSGDGGWGDEKNDQAGKERTPVEARLEQIRLSSTYPSPDMHQTVREWNEGFFSPRGITIDLQEQNASGGEAPHMPGSWDQSFNENPSANQQQQSPNPSSRWWRFNPLNRLEGLSSSINSRGIRLGGLSIDDEGVALGNRFIADSTGLRIGNITADGNGLRYHGRDLFGGPTSSRTWGQPPAPPASHSAPPQPSRPSMPPMPPMSYGHSMPAIPPMPPMPPMPYGNSPNMAAWYAQVPPPPPPGFGPHGHPDTYDEKVDKGDDEHQDHDHTQQEETGSRERGASKHVSTQRRTRSRSCASSSSSSSSSSSASSLSSSDSTVGSFPDYNELRDCQLLLAQSYLEDWLAHPDVFVTRDKVKAAKEELKAAKKSASVAAVAAATSTSNEQKEQAEREHAAQRQQVRQLLGRWERLKKEQRQARKQLRRERRALRKAERRERRQTRRELRRAKTEAKRAAKREARLGHRAAKREERAARREERRGGGDGTASHQHQHAQSNPPPQPPSFGGFPFGAVRGGFGGGFPGVGFGPEGATRGGGYDSHGRGGGMFPFGHRGGGFGPPRRGDFQRGMEDWGRRVSAWSQELGAATAANASTAGRRDPHWFPGAWPQAEETGEREDGEKKRVAMDDDESQQQWRQQEQQQEEKEEENEKEEGRQQQQQQRQQEQQEQRQQRQQWRQQRQQQHEQQRQQRQQQNEQQRQLLQQQHEQQRQQRQQWQQQQQQQHEQERQQRQQRHRWWRQEKNQEQETGVDHQRYVPTESGGPHTISADMYRTLEEKKTQLQAKRDTLADFRGDEGDNGHDGGTQTDDKGPREEKPGASTLVGLLADIEELEKAVTRLGLEADEQFAKELAEQDEH